RGRAHPSMCERTVGEYSRTVHEVETSSPDDRRARRTSSTRAIKKPDAARCTGAGCTVASSRPSFHRSSDKKWDSCTNTARPNAECAQLFESLLPKTCTNLQDLRGQRAMISVRANTRPMPDVWHPPCLTKS